MRILGILKKKYNCFIDIFFQLPRSFLGNAYLFIVTCFQRVVTRTDEVIPRFSYFSYFCKK